MADAAAPAATEPALTDLDKRALVSTADPELTFIFEEVGMELEWQYAIIKAGYAKLRRFANIDDTRTRAALGVYMSVSRFQFDSKRAAKVGLTR